MTAHEAMPEAQRVRLSTDDGLELAGWRWRASDTPRVGVVLVHGFVGRGCSPVVIEHARALSDAGYDVVTYDARGHGASAGRCSLGELERQDVGAAVDGLGRTDRVVLVGESAGGTAVLGYAAHDDRVLGVVTVGAPAGWTMKFNLRTVGAAVLTRTSLGRWAARHLMDVDIHPAWLHPEPPATTAARLAVPLAVLHSEHDPFIPVDEAFRIHAQAAGPCRLELIPGEGHGLRPASVGPVREAVRWCVTRADRAVGAPHQT